MLKLFNYSFFSTFSIFSNFFDPKISNSFNNKFWVEKREISKNLRAFSQPNFPVFRRNVWGNGFRWKWDVCFRSRRILGFSCFQNFFHFQIFFDFYVFFFSFYELLWFFKIQIFWKFKKIQESKILDFFLKFSKKNWNSFNFEILKILNFQFF